MFVGVRTDGREVLYLSNSESCRRLVPIGSRLAGSLGSKRGRVVRRHPEQVGFLRPVLHRARLDEGLSVDDQAQDHAVGGGANGVLFAALLGPRPVGAG
jgi:hypothetical protein